MVWFGYGVGCSVGLLLECCGFVAILGGFGFCCDIALFELSLVVEWWFWVLCVDRFVLAVGIWFGCVGRVGSGCVGGLWFCCVFWFCVGLV